MATPAQISKLEAELNVVAKAGFLDWVYDSKGSVALTKLVTIGDEKPGSNAQKSIERAIHDACTLLDPKWAKAAGHYFGFSSKSKRARPAGGESFFNSSRKRYNKTFTDRATLAASELGGRSSRWFRQASAEFKGKKPCEELVSRVAEILLASSSGSQTAESHVAQVPHTIALAFQRDWNRLRLITQNRDPKLGSVPEDVLTAINELAQSANFIVDEFVRRRNEAAK